MAAPKGDQGPPEQAQGNGPPAQEAPAPAPQAEQQGQAKGQAKKQTQGSTQGTGEVQSGGDAHGKSGGGHSKARGEGHTDGGSSGSVGSQGNSGSQGSTHAKAGKITLCHSTGSSTNPYVEITVSENARHAHERHHDGRDIIPAPAGGCPGGQQQGGGGGGNENEHGKVTLCHATGSETNPYVVITISENALEAHLRHQDGEDIYPVPAGGCPTTAPPTLGNPPSGIVSPPGGEVSAEGTPDADVNVLGVADEGGAPPTEEAAAVLGANQGGGEDAAEVRDTAGTSLPFTGLGLGILVALGALLATAGVLMRRRTAE